MSNNSNAKRTYTHLTSVKAASATEETKRDRFLRIGNARMQRALNGIRLLGNLANSNYEWTEEDVRAMQNSVIDTLTRTVNRFSKKSAEKPTFMFEKVSDL